MATEVEEHIIVSATTADVYAALTQVARMAKWSPECFAVWVYRRDGGVPRRFVGFNRRKGYVWFTTCRVVRAEPGREFAFDVFTFGQPVARWGYRLAAAESTGGAEATGTEITGAEATGTEATGTEATGTEATGTEVTKVTEYWQDRRNKAATTLGRIFTGKVTQDRPNANREGMRTTLARLKRELERG